MIDKETIKNNFSKSAAYYDKYATVQNICAVELAERIGKNECFRKILDIGCGTGNYTAILKTRFPEAGIKAVDISRQMIEVAKKKLQADAAEFVVTDAEFADFTEKFDLITSNVSFQWFGEPEEYLGKYRKLLTRGGSILFSVFGPLTLYELQESMEESFGREARISASEFQGKTEIELILKNVFREFRVEEKFFKEKHASLSGLLSKIKYTGARGSFPKRIWTPERMENLERIYREKFSAQEENTAPGRGITATYQVFFCKGKK